MTVRDVELAIHRANTKRFIESDPSEITLIPSVASKIAGTVKYSDGVPRNPQIFKVIWQADSGIQRQVSSQGGSTRMDFVLVGEFTADIGLKDHFEHSGNRYVVEWIAPPNGYEVKAGGVSHGSSPNL